MSDKKRVPGFVSEDEEREFWAERDATDFVGFRAAEDVILPKLRPTTRTISLRLPESLLASIKVAAHKRDVPYQPLIKMMLADAIDREHSGSQPSP